MGSLFCIGYQNKKAMPYQALPLIIVKKYSKIICRLSTRYPLR